MFGLVALGYLWARTALAARERLEGGTEEADFYEAKLATARFFMARVLPETSSLLSKITSGAEPVMALKAEAF